MTLKPKTILLISTLFVLAGVAATLSTGLWQTESTKIPKRLEATTPTQGAEGAYDPADIRGS